MDKQVLMIRLNNTFDEQYVENVSIADFRVIPVGKTKREYETDYIFTYKEKRYRSNEYVCKKLNGTLLKPISFLHTLVSLD